MKERLLDSVAERPGEAEGAVPVAVSARPGRECAWVDCGALSGAAALHGVRSGSPGRIVAELRRGGVRNPVFVLDEIDRLDEAGSTRHQQVEQDRAPALLSHHGELARHPADDVRDHRRPHRERPDSHRAPGPGRTRRRGVSDGRYGDQGNRWTHSRWSPMRFTGNGITNCYPDEVDNFVSITVLIEYGIVAAVGVFVFLEFVGILSHVSHMTMSLESRLKRRFFNWLDGA